MDLKKDLNEKALNYGIDVFGIASAGDFDDAPRGHRPTDILPRAKSVIILGMKMLDAQTDLLPIEGDVSQSSPRQAMFSGHNGLLSQQLDRAGYDLARHLERTGFLAFHQMSSTGGIDQRYLTGLLSLKHMAVQAGLGVIGKNTLLITPQFGPRVRLTGIVTNAELQSDKLISNSFCVECSGLCIANCPAGALKEPAENAPYEINKFACNQFLTTRPSCSVCLKVCPVGSERVR